MFSADFSVNSCADSSASRAAGVRVLNDAWRRRLGSFVVPLYWRKGTPRLANVTGARWRVDQSTVAVANDRDESMHNLLRRIHVIHSEEAYYFIRFIYCLCSLISQETKFFIILTQL